MSSSPDAPRAAQPIYRIGAVARLTGLSTHTLRKWEDRHALIAPRRSDGGERLYSAEDVQRVSLARDLARAGMPLGDLAALPTDELERLLGETRRAACGDGDGDALPGERLALAVLGPALSSLMRADSGQWRRAHLLAGAADSAALRTALAGDAPDVLVVEYPTVDEETPAALADLMADMGAGAALVVYGFGTHANVDALRRADVALVRSPVDAVEVERHCLGLAVALWDRWPAVVGVPTAELRSPRRFSREVLARVARMSTDIACECPRHLADLIMSLDAFEDYSAACESRDDKDAALHRHLYETAVAGRTMLEEALARVADHEGIETG